MNKPSAAHAFFLAGPTASGKSAVAEWIARNSPGFELLSADSMQVYRGLDVGTAKTPPAERTGIVYHGLDLVDPAQPFSVVDWLRVARRALAAAAERGNSVIVVGGTGLYLSALLRGIDGTARPASAPEERRRWTDLFAAEGVDGLQRAAEARCQGILARMPDPANPRRLVRVLERLERGEDPLPKSATPRIAPIPALSFDPAELAVRIERRVDRMLAGGALLDETRALLERFPEWANASAAIGYAEARAVLRGECDLAAARERIAARTRQLAKRQRTWFRTQLPTLPVDGPASEDDVPAVAQAILRIYGETGPAPCVLPEQATIPQAQ